MRRTAQNSQIVVRPCRARDFDGVLELWKRAGGAPSVTDDVGALRLRLARDRELFVLAWEGSRLIGSLIGGWDGWRDTVARLAVDPEYRRRGVAKALVAAVERRLRAIGAKRINCLVLEDNALGASFWHDVGYHHDVQVRRYVKDLE